MYDDNELMLLAQEGNPRAYETLVLKHRVRAVEFANSFVLNFHTAEDIVQECFAKIYINRLRYKPTFTFKTYLFTIIRNHCIDTLRKAKLLHSVPLDSWSEAACADTPETILAAQELQKNVFAILNSLQDDYKTALYLFAVDEMSYKEIACVMRKTIPQTKITIYRARQKLRKQYEGAEIDEK